MQQFSPYTTRPHTHSRIFWQLLADIPPENDPVTQAQAPDRLAGKLAGEPAADG